MRPMLLRPIASFLVFFIWFLSSTTQARAESQRFIPATQQNTYLADGSPLPGKIESIGWKWSPEKGNGGMFESSTDHGDTSAILLMKAAGLEPGALYEVFGFFWEEQASSEGEIESPHHAVQLGLSIATMYPFAGVRSDDLVSKESWVITPGYRTGQAYGYEAVIEEGDPLPGLAGVSVSQGKSKLIRARLGCSRAGKDGTLPVFFSANFGSLNVGSAVVDGFVVRPAAADASPDLGRKPGTRLQLAIRAGDPFTIQREIEAVGDVNALDEDGITPLFYAAASGDAALVRKLLDHGAKPNFPSQSMPPLTAAATIGDTEITRLLLDAGAKVPLSATLSKGALTIDIDPRFLHPVVAAIRAGSVPVLKQLLGANKDFSIPKFEKELREMETQTQPKLHSMFLIGSSMLRMNWEMAAYLIDSGASITCRAYSQYTNPAGLMLADAVHAGTDARPVMEAMLRRGEPVVTKADYRSDDALNTAAWHGNVELVRRFLPLATNVELYYQIWLLERALDSGNPEIIGMIRSKFPDAKVPRWQPAPESDTTTPLEESAKRWFLPRTTPPKASPNPVKGKHVLAVITAPDAAGVGDILAAHASQADDWKVVDREQIEAALGEDRFSKPWLDGEHRLADLGDHLLADCLVVVSSIRVGKESIYRFEVVEVATGLEIHREHLKSDAFVDKKEVTGFLERATRALEAAGQNERHQAITLVSFSAQGPIESPSAISGLLRAAVQYEVDSTPGLISLSRAQSSRLKEEQALDGKNSVWGAAHMVEGVVSADGDKGIKVVLRLETFKNGATSKTDAEAIGETGAIAETTALAWKKLMESSGIQIAGRDDHPSDTGRALNEGRRLIREVDWLQSMNAEPASYLPLIESALALGVPAEETILLHLDAHFRNFIFLYPGNSDAQPERNHKHTSVLQHLPDILSHEPATLAISDQTAYHLPTARNFLHQTSWYLEHQGKDGLDGGTDVWQTYGSYKSNEIWYAIQALSTIRAVIIPGQIPDSLKPEFETFSAELDTLTRRYFAVLQTVPNPDFYRYYLQSADFRLYERNPVLAEGLAGMAATGASLTSLLHIYPFANPDNGDGIGTKYFQEMASSKFIALKMIQCIGNNPPLHMRTAKADLECFVAENSQRPRAIRKLNEACAESRWHTTPTREEMGAYLLSQVILNSSTPSYLFDRFGSTNALGNNGSLLPSVLFSARPAPDLSIRFNTYHRLFHVLNQQEGWRRIKVGTNVDTYRESIQAYDSWELRRLQAEALVENPVNGAPSRTGRSSRNGPPGIGVTPESKTLISMIFGAGKNRVKHGNTEKPADKKPEPAPLQATLLADLRTRKSPGTIIWPLVDNVDPDLLWMFYFPSAGDGIRVSQPGGGGALNYGHVYDAPWLLGINCRDGSIVHRVNLHAAVGKAYGMDLSHRKCNVWNMALDQTQDRILTSVGWHDDQYASNKMGSVIIEKKTGKAYPIQGNPELLGCRGDVSLDLWDRHNGVAAVGDHFFYLNHAGEWTGGAIKGMRSSEMAVFQVFPDLSVKPLTIMGRRPELTPFDAPNRAPISITSHGERLMVIHPATIAEYDPVKSDWSITAALPSEKPTNKHTDTVADAQYWDFLRSIHELKVDGESTGWIAVGWWHQPGVLPFASRTKGRRTLRIAATIPEDFLNTTYASEEPTFDKDGMHEAPKKLIKDHPRFKETDVVVIAQTEKYLILGMQTGDYYGWNYPSRNCHHLPFLWKVSKQEILNKLNDE